MEVSTAGGVIGCVANCGKADNIFGGRPRRQDVVGAGGVKAALRVAVVVVHSVYEESRGGLFQLQVVATLTEEAKGGWRPEWLQESRVTLPCRC